MTERGAREHARQEPQAAAGDWHRPAVGVVLAGAAWAAFLVGMLGLPRESAALPAIARHALAIAEPRWGTTEAVSEVVYGSRGFDTFGETFLLLAAVISVVTLARPREPRHEYVGESSAGLAEQQRVDPHGRGDREQGKARTAESAEEAGTSTPANPDRIGLGTPAPERAEAMTVVVRVAARTAAVMLAVAAVYLAALGYTPGGGFPAGAALAGVAVLLYTALGRKAVQALVRPAVLEPVEMLGAVAIIVIGVLGLALKGSLFANYLKLAELNTIRAGGTEQPYSAAELIEVATGLTIAIFSLLGAEHDWAPDSDNGNGEAGGDGTAARTSR